MRRTSRNLLGAILGIWLGWQLTPSAQSAINITRSGIWQAEVECAIKAPLTIAVDGGVPAAPTLTWTGTGPFIAKIDYPNTAGARTIGAHTFVVTNPGVSVTLADGSTVSYSAGSVTVTVNVFDDPPGPQVLPRILRWLRILGGGG